jgi:hypothetical protein
MTQQLKKNKERFTPSNIYSVTGAGYLAL